jgi:hypothetical protein
MNVVAVPLIALRPIVAVGFAPVGTVGICEVKASVPEVAGSVKVVVPETAFGVIVAEPEVEPGRVMEEIPVRA